MDDLVKAITEATEKTLGAVFPPAKEPMRRYSQGVAILAELEQLGYRVERAPKTSR